MFCVGYGIYKSIFHNKHKTLYNLFSPGPAVSCVADTQASHHVVFHLGVCHLYPPQTLFVLGILFSPCPSVRVCVRNVLFP